MASKEKIRELRCQADNIVTENPTGLFPEFDFQRRSKGWCSGNSLKLDGSYGASKHKVWIYDNRPGFLFDYRGNVSVSFWDYLENVRLTPSPLTTLMDYAGLEIPTVQSDYQAKPELIADTHPMILKRCMSLFADALHCSESGRPVLSYLSQRGYSERDIIRMKLGALPDLPLLHQQLSELPLDKKYINFFVKRMEAFSEHPLTVPSYGKRGKLEGFVFRNIVHEDVTNDIPKYKNMLNMKRDDSVLNVPNDCSDIIIVEGILDALLAKARNQRNVVPLQGSSLSDYQLDSLAALKVTRLIFCLDNDETGRESTRRNVERALYHDYPFEIYVVALAAPYKDADAIIRQRGIAGFQEEVYYAIGVGEYLAMQLMMQFPKRNQSRPLPALMRTRLHQAAAPFRSQLISQPLELEDFDTLIDTYVRTSNHL
jgi:DNA primase